MRENNMTPYTYKRIAQIFEKHPKTIQRWLDRYGIKRQRSTSRSVVVTVSEFRRLEIAIARNERV